MNGRIHGLLVVDAVEKEFRLLLDSNLGMEWK